MPNGSNTLDQLRKMAGEKELSTEQAMPLLLAGMADTLDHFEKQDGRIAEITTRLVGVENQSKKNAENILENKEDIAEVKKKSDLWDKFLTAFVALFGAFSSWVGLK